jgi:hypothetical protein
MTLSSHSIAVRQRRRLCAVLEHTENVGTELKQESCDEACKARRNRRYRDRIAALLNTSFRKARSNCQSILSRMI